MARTIEELRLFVETNIELLNAAKNLNPNIDPVGSLLARGGYTAYRDVQKFLNGEDTYINIVIDMGGHPSIGEEVSKLVSRVSEVSAPV